MRVSGYTYHKDHAKIPLCLFSDGVVSPEISVQSYKSYKVWKEIRGTVGINDAVILSCGVKGLAVGSGGGQWPEFHPHWASSVFKVGF